MTEKRKSFVFVGFVGVVVGIIVQVIAAILQTNPSMNVTWALVSFVFIFPGCIFMIEGYVSWSERVNPRIGLVLLVFAFAAIVFQIAFYNNLIVVFVPRTIIPSLLFIDSVAIFLTGLLFPRIASQGLVGKVENISSKGVKV